MKLYWARRPFGYAGQELDRGQVVRLAGALNDEKLVRLGYFQAADQKAATSECGRCGARFVAPEFRDAHVRARHLGRELTPQEEDALAERREAELEQVAPLYLDKAAANRR